MASLMFFYCFPLSIFRITQRKNTWKTLRLKGGHIDNSLLAENGILRAIMLLLKFYIILRGIKKEEAVAPLKKTSN